LVFANDARDDYGEKLARRLPVPTSNVHDFYNDLNVEEYPEPESVHTAIFRSLGASLMNVVKVSTGE
jgi:hypothetical protein